MKINELRWSKQIPVTTYIQHDATPGDKDAYTNPMTGKTSKWVQTPVKDERGGIKMTTNFSKPHFRKGAKEVGDILGPVGDWLDLMGATRADVAVAYENIKRSPEYQDIIDLGFEDQSSPGDVKNGTFNFIGYEEAVVGSEDERRDRIRRKVLANGTVRTFSNFDDYHAGRGKVPHPLTAELAPDLTPAERVEHTVRASLKYLKGLLQQKMTKAFKRKLMQTS